MTKDRKSATQPETPAEETPAGEEAGAETPPKEASPEETSPKEASPEETTPEETSPPEAEAAEPTPQERIAALETEAASQKDQLLRALAEVENTRRRAELDRREAARYGVAGLARDLLSVADNLRRALESLPEEARKDEAEWVKNFILGVELTEKELLGAFAKQTIEKIDPLDQPFDHTWHQAMFELPDTGKAAGTVVQMLQAGYRLHDRLLRPAMVGVARGDPAATDAPGAEAPEAGEEEPGDAAG